MTYALCERQDTVIDNDLEYFNDRIGRVEATLADLRRPDQTMPDPVARHNYQRELDDLRYKRAMLVAITQ